MSDRRIWKVTLTAGRTAVDLPGQCHWLAAGYQDGSDLVYDGPGGIVAWVDVAPGQLANRHVLEAVNTGDSPPDDAMAYIGTCTSTAGIVWHVYEVMP